MADDLDDEERELLKKHRAAKQRDAFRVRIRDDKGNEADLPYHKGKTWLQKVFGIDLDDEDVQDGAGGEGKGNGGGDGGGGGEGGNVKRFQSGRRVS